MEMRRSIRRLRQFICHNDLYWRYIANARPWLEYGLSHQSAVTPVQRSIIKGLRRNGVAITTGQALFGDTALVDKLSVEVKGLESKLSDEISEARQRKDAEGFKTFLVQLLGPCPILDPESIFVRIAVTPHVLGVINGYFGMMTRLRFYNVWLNFASTAPARYSQLWHRDPEDRRIIKMFVYLTDVDDEAGPLFYAPGTHSYGNVKREPTLFREAGTTAYRADDSSMSAVVDSSKWVKAVGPRGTIVFVDTTGYHKGGLARCRDRIAYNCMFTSQGSMCGDFFKREKRICPTDDKALAFALGSNGLD